MNFNDARGASTPETGVDHSILLQINDTLRELADRLACLERKLEPAAKEYLTVEEFAELVGRSAYTVREWLKSGKIRGERVVGTGPRGRWIIPRNQLRLIVENGGGASVPAICL